jgi:hypothetical protein
VISVPAGSDIEIFSEDVAAARFEARVIAVSLARVRADVEARTVVSVAPVQIPVP